jgi:hypothetical protein
MKYKIVFILIILILLNGCSLKQPAKKGDGSWQNEVLWAQECGMDGLPCCPNKEQPCLYNQVCCQDPNNAKNNYCAESCQFGQEKTFCRQNEPKCDPGLACVDSRCTLCGKDKQACCNGNEPCQNDLICYQEKCVKCGLSGNPCCTAGQACLNQDKRDGTRNECYNNVCVFCGANSGIVCHSEPKCNQGHLLNNGFCLPCGSYNQPCCDQAAGMDYECDPTQNLNCLLGFCSKIK